MQVLVIGGTGFLSGAVVDEARERGHSVSVVTRGGVNRPAPPEGVTALRADRTDPDALRAAIGDKDWDVVIDCVLFKPQDVAPLVDILNGRADRYVFISTDFVYGGEPRQYPVFEDAPRRALSPYGAQKAACEDALFDAHAQNNFPAVALRPPHIMGAGSLLGSGSLQGRDPWLLWRLRNGKTLFLLDGGELLIQPVHKRDIARAALAAALSDAAPGRAYNIAGPDAVSTRRYYEMIGERLGLAPDALKIAALPSAAYRAAWPDKAPFCQNRVYSTLALMRDTGYLPTVSLAESIDEMVSALDAHSLPSGNPPRDDEPLQTALAQGSEAIKEALLRATVATA